MAISDLAFPMNSENRLDLREWADFKKVRLGQVFFDRKLNFKKAPKFLALLARSASFLTASDSRCDPLRPASAGSGNRLRDSASPLPSSTRDRRSHPTRRLDHNCPRSFPI